MAANDTPMVPVQGQHALAWVVVLAILAVGLLLIIIPAFSAHNTRASVDGDQSVYSHYLDDGAER